MTELPFGLTLGLKLLNFFKCRRSNTNAQLFNKLNRFQEQLNFLKNRSKHESEKNLQISAKTVTHIGPY